jgi:hypothetical protein
LDKGVILPSSFHPLIPEFWNLIFVFRIITADLVVDEVQSLSKIPGFSKKSGICLCTSLEKRCIITYLYLTILLVKGKANAAFQNKAAFLPLFPGIGAI